MKIVIPTLILIYGLHWFLPSLSGETWVLLTAIIVGLLIAREYGVRK